MKGLGDKWYACVIKTYKNAMVGKSGKIAPGKIQSTGNNRNRVGKRETKRKREHVTGRRERVQLKLAQFSHSPVIRMPGIYIIKSRKFLSSFYSYHVCMRALVQPLCPACPISYFTFSTLCFPCVFSAERRFIAAIIVASKEVIPGFEANYV